MKPRIAPWARILMGVGGAFILFALRLGFDAEAHNLKTLSACLLGVGGGVIIAISMVVLEEVLEIVRPRREERTACAHLWNENNIRQVEAAIADKDPAVALRNISQIEENLRDFHSNDIYRDIENMHEGAFLGAIHIWGDIDGYDEEFMADAPDHKLTELQRKIKGYRERVATQIGSRELLATRRYRVHKMDHISFMGNTVGAARVKRLGSLTSLVMNVAKDLASQWHVDVEFFQEQRAHNPNLDYALLFGARGSATEMPRIAFITHRRERLIAAQDYVGVSVDDPAVLKTLLKDRFRADPGLKTGRKFIQQVVPYVSEELRTLKADTTGYPQPLQDELARIETYLKNGPAKQYLQAATPPAQQLMPPQP